MTLARFFCQRTANSALKKFLRYTAQKSPPSRQSQPYPKKFFKMAELPCVSPDRHTPQGIPTNGPQTHPVRPVRWGFTRAPGMSGTITVPRDTLDSGHHEPHGDGPDDREAGILASLG